MRWTKEPQGWSPDGDGHQKGSNKDVAFSEPDPWVSLPELRNILLNSISEVQYRQDNEKVSGLPPRSPVWIFLLMYTGGRRGAGSQTSHLQRPQ